MGPRQCSGPATRRAGISFLFNRRGAGAPAQNLTPVRRARGCSKRYNGQRGPVTICSLGTNDNHQTLSLLVPTGASHESPTDVRIRGSPRFKTPRQRGKKREILGPQPTFRTPPFRTPPFGTPLFGLHFFWVWAPPLGAPPPWGPNHEINGLAKKKNLAKIGRARWPKT